MKMKRREKLALLGIGLAAYLSGALLFYLSRWSRVMTAIGEQHREIEHPVRAIHSALTYVVVLALGYLIKGHVMPGLKSRTGSGLKSGVAMLTLFFVLVTTALIVMYAGDYSWVGSVALIHALVGLAIPLILIPHALIRIAPARVVQTRALTKFASAAAGKRRPRISSGF